MEDLLEFWDFLRQRIFKWDHFGWWLLKCFQFHRCQIDFKSYWVQANTNNFHPEQWLWVIMIYLFRTSFWLWTQRTKHYNECNLICVNHSPKVILSLFRWSLGGDEGLFSITFKMWLKWFISTLWNDIIH